MTLNPVRISLVATMVLVISTFSGCSVATDIVEAIQVSEVFENAYDVDPGSRLVLQNSNGDVTVMESDDHQLHVRATKRSFLRSWLEEVSISVQPGPEFAISTEQANPRTRVSVQYTVWVPQNMSVERVQTSNGSVTVEHVQGDVRAQSSNGSIELAGINGYVTALTSNGSITVRDCSGVDGIRTSNGTVTAWISDLRADTEIRTSNGTVTAHLCPHLAADIRMRTSNGRVSADHPELAVHEESRTFLEGSIAGGGPLLTLRSSNGNVDLLLSR